MDQFFALPDLYIGRAGRLNATVVERRIPDAPGFMRGVKALFVTDIHALPRTTRENCLALRAKIEALAPDLLLFGGDYADRAEDCARLFEALSGLRPPLGWFGVLGNNDREAWSRIGTLRHLMEDAGCTLLVNQHRHITVAGGTLWIGGVDELYHGRPYPAKALPPERESGVYSILISHYPKAEEPLPDLILSGHTHGGQFNLLGVTPYAIGFERLMQPRLSARAFSGMRRVRGTRMLVSKGIGASRIPLRVGVRPEIDLMLF